VPNCRYKLREEGKKALEKKQICLGKIYCTPVWRTAKLLGYLLMTEREKGELKPLPCSFGLLTTTSQQYFSLRTNQSPAKRTGCM
jgi:hypothetical protein